MMSDLPNDVQYDELTEAFLVDLGDDTYAEIMGRRRHEKAIEFSGLRARVATLEAQLAELREAASNVVSWDWRKLQEMPDHIDWVFAPRAIDALEKALKGEESK